MKILFDQGTPAPLRHALTGHVVFTAFEKGWSTLKNGELIQKAEGEGFDAMVTTDQNLKYQQDLSGRTLAILVLPSTSWPAIQKHLGLIWDSVSQLKPGAFFEVGF